MTAARREELSWEELAGVLPKPSPSPAPSLFEVFNDSYAAEPEGSAPTPYDRRQSIL